MPEPEPTAAARYLRKMSHGVAAASTGAVEAATSEALSPERADEAFGRALRIAERESGRPIDASTRDGLEKVLCTDGKEALARLHNDGAQAELDARHEDALEAIVEVDGSRPALAFSDADRIDLEDEILGQWRQVVKKFAEQISKVANAVGRIDLNGQHQGTGFVIANRLILTNRHVLQGLADQHASGEWEFRGEPTITFDANPGASPQRVKIRKHVVRAGSQFIDPANVDPRKLDFAVLECDLSAGATFPQPLQLERDADKIAAGRPIFTVGYPAKPPHGLYDSSVLQQLFQYRYGIKRFAPGEIDRGLGSDEERTGGTVFAHDATTLGGNSGSCVVDLGNDGRLVVGLHFMGRAKQANYAHSNARLYDALADLHLDWKDWLPQ